MYLEIKERAFLFHMSQKGLGDAGLNNSEGLEKQGRKPCKIRKPLEAITPNLFFSMPSKK